MTQEYWLPVPCWEGLYEVSSHGRLRRGGRIIKGCTNAAGYQNVILRGRGNRSTCIHILVAEAFIGPRPDGMVVRHGENGASDNSVGNLSYGTQKQNIHDKKRDGTWQIADTAARRTLTSDQVVIIYQSAKTSPELAEDFGVDQTTIRAIWRGKNWRSVTVSLPSRQVRGRLSASSQPA